MKAIVHIEAYTMSAYRAIRPALVNSNVGYLGVSGMVFSATIDSRDYAYLVDVVKNAAQSAGIHHSEYAIITLQNISQPSKN
ncbi:MAG: hypothetical protein IKU00_08770 [Bacteroidales bacterium]|nr:hypothetical protein [Bacteroidales bacterium]